MPLVLERSSYCGPKVVPAVADIGFAYGTAAKDSNSAPLTGSFSVVL
jgi:hypothetical protein